ncbi:hypothetical protein KSK55_12915 [Methanospirillum purgamenti]|jgi:hypothetical protein|uniref:Uncharacterized protein n=1 Tax=Methanospirillum hungatei TaxID=2203 RepID=A0A8F5ZF79_METHU|nr:hypothetical protein [Methanospirillum hungatei]QXO94224.1 hypothetical protein KSK55_12915 [Methanospirillum hungatei]
MPKVTVNDLDIYYKIPDMLLVPDPYHVTHKYHPFMRPEPLPPSDIDRISLIPLIGAANAALALFDRLFRSKKTRISSSPRLSCRKPSYHPG